MLFSIIIAGIVGLVLLLTFILLLYRTKDTRDVSITDCYGKDYTPPTFYCPYVNNRQCRQINTSTMEKLACGECSQYPMNQPLKQPDYYDEYADKDPIEAIL